MPARRTFAQRAATLAPGLPLLTTHDSHGYSISYQPCPNALWLRVESRKTPAAALRGLKKSLTFLSR
jgi:hypothetical protein